MENVTPSQDNATYPLQPFYTDSVLATVTAAYAVIFVVGIIGNVCTCVVVVRKRYVHSQTPFYLNLAFSDLMLLVIGLPTDVFFIWRPYQTLGGTWFCILKAVVTETATNASILTIVVFTAERWISICHPFESRAAASSQNVISPASSGAASGKSAKWVSVIWIVALAAAVPLSAQMGVVPIADSTGALIPGADMCHVVSSRAISYAFVLSSLVFFVIPMVLITVFYLLILVQLRKAIMSRRRSINDSPLMHAARRARQQAKASGTVVKILIAVVVAFFICFSPYHFQRLAADYLTNEGNDESLAYFAQTIFTISGLSYYVSTATNPVIYCLLSKRFRFALRNLFCRRRIAEPPAKTRPVAKELLLVDRWRRDTTARCRPTPGIRRVDYGNRNTSPGYRRSFAPARDDKYTRQVACILQNLQMPAQLSPSHSFNSHSSLHSCKSSKRDHSIACNNRSPKGAKKAPIINIDDCSNSDQCVCMEEEMRWKTSRSDCYTVYYDGDRLVISFTSESKRKPGCSV